MSAGTGRESKTFPAASAPRVGHWARDAGNCYVYGWFTFEVDCRDCRLSAFSVLQNDTPLAAELDILTYFVLDSSHALHNPAVLGLDLLLQRYNVKKWDN
jgi:hypothetical protein